MILGKIKRLASLFVVLTFAFVAPTFAFAQSTPVCPTLTTTLKPGSQGVDVALLQTFLAGQQLIPTSDITSYYGQETAAAVFAIQVSQGVLSPSATAAQGAGYVGPQTRGIILAMCSAGGGTVKSKPITTPTTPTQTATPSLDLTRNLSLGSKGTDVSELQQFLKDAGFYTYPTVTGYFGPATKAAVMAYQAAHGISTVGTVGPITRASITSVSSGGVSSATGSSSTSSGSQPSRGSGSGGGQGSFGTSVSSPSSGSTPDVTPPSISAVSAGSIGLTSATITWATDESADSQLAYGLSTAYGATTTLNTSLTTSHSVTLTGLSSNTTYHYRVRSADASGNTAYSSDYTFTTAAPDVTPPVISAIASSTAQTTATINWTTDENSTSKVAYGTSSGTYTTATSSASLTTSHVLGITGLTASTKYYFVVVSTDASGNTATSSENTFTTTASIPLPSISSIASSTTQTSATITWTTNTNTSSTVNYGTTSSYGNASTTSSLVTTHSITLSGLSSGTTYHFQISSTDATSNTATSSDLTFTTAIVPVISSVASSTTQTTATITWNTNENTNSLVNYGGTTSYGTASSSAAYATTHSITLSGLSSGTTYHFQIVSTDASNYAATSTDYTFTTSATLPVISGIGTSTTQTTATITWSTNTNTSSLVNYGTTTSYGTASSSAALVTSHSITLTGLTANTTYHFQLSSTDGSSNTATSSDQTFTTSALPSISNIATSTTSSTATITWSTNTNTDSTVNYGTTTSYGNASTTSALVTSHSITLTGLSSSTTYHFQISSTDGSSNTATSSDQTFTTSSGTVANGTVTAASIESNGYIADIQVQGLAAGGTYSLTPDSSPKLTFNVATHGYDSTGSPITVNRSIYGTVAYRYPYPNGATTTESVSGSTLTSQVVLSDDILPTDTVTLTGASGWYTSGGTPTVSVSALSTTNNSTASEYRLIGAWVTPTNLRRASTTPFTAEFTVVSRFPRNNGQVAAVKFIASDGTNTVSHTISSMTQSTYLTSTTCTATSGSAVLTSCGSTTGFIPGQYLTVSTGSGSGVGIGEPKVSSVDSTTQITLNTTATATGTVTVTIGNPVYVYAATFSSTEMNSLAQGTTTIEAIAYTNVGTMTLDTAQGADGTPIASSVITPNLKNLQVLNDKNDKYDPIYAWVSPSGAGTSPAVQTTATDPGSTAYYSSIKAAADAIKTYYTANDGHSDACGGIIYLKVGTTTGFGGSLLTDSPTKCSTYLTISAEPGHGPTDVDIDATSTYNNAGDSTMFQNVHLTDNASNKIVISGPDSSSSNRAAHMIFKNSWLQETQSSPSSFIYQVGQRDYYNDLIDETVADGRIMTSYSTTGVTSTEYGTTGLGNTTNFAGVLPYTVLGNVFSAVRSTNLNDETSTLLAFNKFMNVNNAQISAQTYTGGATYNARNNSGFAQNVFEEVGSSGTSPAFSFGADDDISAFSNLLRQYNTITGNRTNMYYNSLGGTPVTKTGNDMFNIDLDRYGKSDYFANPLDRYVVSITVTNGGSGYSTSTVTISAPTGTNNPVTALAHANLSGGSVSSITLDTTICGNTGGLGYSSTPTVTITGDGTGATATATLDASGSGQSCGSRNGNWRFRFGVGDIGDVTGPNGIDSGNPPAYWAAQADSLGLAGATSTPGYNQNSYTWKVPAENTLDGGTGAGMGYYKPATNTGLMDRVPAGYAGFPGDIEGTPRKNDGTGCAGAYEC